VFGLEKKVGGKKVKGKKQEGKKDNRKWKDNLSCLEQVKVEGKKVKTFFSPVCFNGKYQGKKEVYL
jgi:hypothetical protein